jgi:hypothetical protein
MSASVGEPWPAPGIFIKAIRKDSSAQAGLVEMIGTPVATHAEAAPTVAAPFNTSRRLACMAIS